MSTKTLRRTSLIILFVVILCLLTILFTRYSSKDHRQMQLWSTDNEVSAVAISDNQLHIAAGDIKGNIIILQRRQSDAYQSWKISEFEITEIRFYLDDHTIITKTSDDITQLWNIETHTLIRTFGSDHSKSSPTPDSNGNSRRFILGGNHALDVSSDNSIVATGKAQGIVELFSVQTGSLIHRLQGHGIVGYSGKHVPVAQVAFDAQSRHLASLGDDGSIAIWDVKSGDNITSFPENYNFSPPKKILFSFNSQSVTTLGGSFIKYQSLDSVTNTLHFTGKINTINSAAITFFQDSETYARGGENRSGLPYVFPWNGSTVDTNIYIERLHPDQPTSIGVLEGHEAWITSLALTKDDNLLVSGSYDKTVRLWSIPK